MIREVVLAPSDAAAFAREYESNLRHGRSFVTEHVDAELLSEVTLVVVRPLDGARFVVRARVVMKLATGPMQGTALELDAGDPELRARLAEFAEGRDEAIDPPSLGAPIAQAAELPDLGDPDAPDALDDADQSESPDAPDSSEAERGAMDSPADRGPLARLRKLGAAERMKLAREGNLEERVLLERLFGKSLWEELLRNPQLTVPEVARIAAKGTAPRIMLEQIVDNPAWSRQSIVRRALLANPRVSNDAIQKLLRSTSRNELKLIVQTAAYPALVRVSARKLLDP